MLCHSIYRGAIPKALYEIHPSARYMYFLPLFIELSHIEIAERKPCCCQFVVKMLSKPQMGAKRSLPKQTQGTKKARFLGLLEWYE